MSGAPPHPSFEAWFVARVLIDPDSFTSESKLFQNFRNFAPGNKNWAAATFKAALRAKTFPAGVATRRPTGGGFDEAGLTARLSTAKTSETAQ